MTEKKTKNIKMNNWDINLSNHGYELVHRCDNNMQIAIMDREGEWCCIHCRKHAPKDIQNVADLAKCRTLPPEDWFK